VSDKNLRPELGGWVISASYDKHRMFGRRPSFAWDGRGSDVVGMHWQEQKPTPGGAPRAERSDKAKTKWRVYGA